MRVGALGELIEEELRKARQHPAHIGEDNVQVIRHHNRGVNVNTKTTCRFCEAVNELPVLSVVHQAGTSALCIDAQSCMWFLEGYGGRRPIGASAALLFCALCMGHVLIVGFHLPQTGSRHKPPLISMSSAV